MIWLLPLTVVIATVCLIQTCNTWRELLFAMSGAICAFTLGWFLAGDKPNKPDDPKP